MNDSSFEMGDSSFEMGDSSFEIGLKLGRNRKGIE